MTKLKDIKLRLSKLLLNCGMVKTDKGILSFDGEELQINAIVYIEDEEGTRTDVEDGEYVDEEGRTIVVKDSKVIEIKEKAEEPTAEEPTEDVVVEADDVEEPKDEKEEKPEEPEVDAIEEIRKEINELYKIVDSILDKIGESRDKADEEFAKINSRVEKVENKSLAKPAEEEFVAVSPKNTFSKKIENFRKGFESIR